MPDLVPLPTGSLLSTYQRAHTHTLRRWPLPLRHPAPQHLPRCPASLPLPLPVQWETESQPVRQWQSVCQPPGDLDRQGNVIIRLSLGSRACAGLLLEQVTSYQTWMTSALGWCLSWGGLGFGLCFRCLEQITGVVWFFLGLYLAQLSFLNEKSVVRAAIAEVPTPAWGVSCGLGPCLPHCGQTM